LKNFDECIIAKRHDGFTISLLTPKDFPNLLEIVDNLSEEQKINFHRDVFMKHPSLLGKFLQIFVKLSLRPFTGKIIKKIIPRFYFVIFKCEDPNNQIVGFYSVQKFKKLANGKYIVNVSIAIVKQFQGKGLSTFILENGRKYLKRNNVSKIFGTVRPTNLITKKIFKKFGMRYVKTTKNAAKYKNKLYDSETWITDLDA